MTVAAVCPHCQTAVPRAVVESSIARVVHCAGCRSMMLWGNGRVLRALREGGEGGEGEATAPAGGGRDRNNGTSANGTTSAAPPAADRPATTHERFSVPLSNVVVESGSVPVHITPTAVTRRPSPPRAVTGGGGALHMDGAMAARAAEATMNVVTLDELVPVAGRAVPASSVTVTAPSMLPALDEAASSRFDPTGTTERRSAGGAITAPSVAAAAAAASSEMASPRTPEGSARATRIVAVAAVALFFGGLVVARWGRESAPAVPAPKAAGPIAAVAPAAAPPEAQVPSVVAPPPLAAPTATADPTLPAKAAAAVTPAPPLPSRLAGAPVHLSPAQRKAARRQAAQVARQQAKSKRAEKRRVALAAKAQKKLEKRQAALARAKATKEKRAAAGLHKGGKSKRTAAGGKHRIKRRKSLKSASQALTMGRLVAGPMPTLSKVVHEGRKGAKGKRAAPRGKKHARALGGRVRRGGKHRGAAVAPPVVSAPVQSLPPLVDTARPVSPGVAPVPAADGQPADGQAAEALRVARARNASQQGHARLFEGDSAEAERRYRAALAELPTYVAALRGLGMALARQGRGAEAIEAWTSYCTQAARAHDVWLIRRHIERLRVNPAALAQPIPAAPAPAPTAAPTAPGR